MGLFSFIGSLLGLTGPQAQEITVAKAASAEGLPIIYGQRKVSPINVFKVVSRHNGPVTLANYDIKHEPQSGDGNDEVRKDYDWLHRIGVWGQGPITGVTGFWIDGDRETVARFKKEPYFRATSYYGDSGQTAATDLTAAAPRWGAAQVGNGVAYSWLRFYNSSKKPQFRADPRVEAEVKGLKVWDPRRGERGAASNWVYSANRALVLLDYLTAAYGANLFVDGTDMFDPACEVNVASFITAADQCDELWTVAAPPVNSGSEPLYDYDPDDGNWKWVVEGDRLFSHRADQSSSSQPRYSCHAVLDPKSGVLENIKMLLEEFGWSLPWSNGQVKLVIEAPQGAPVMHFGEGTILGGWVTERGRRDKRFNRITITFPNRNKQYEPDSVSWPKLDGTQHEAFKAQDHGQDLHSRVSARTVTDHYQALAYAEFLVRKSRIPLTVESLQLGPEAILLEPGDVIALTDSHQGFNDRWFIVEKVTISGTLEVTVALSDYDATVYGLEDPDEEPRPDYDGSPNPWDEPPAVENLHATELHENHGAGGVVSGVSVTWDMPDGTPGVEDIVISWAQKPGADTPTEFPGAMRLPPEARSAYIGGLIDDRTYTVRAVYTTRLGQESAEALFDIDLSAQENQLRSIISGSGVPGSGTGLVGWTYIDVDTGDVYEKTSSGWGTPTGNIAGNDGDNWHSGAGAPSSAIGTAGDYYLNTNNGDVYRKSGDGWGSPITNIHGADGSPTYTWIAYADNASGANFTTGAPGDRTYVGIATNKSTPSESSNWQNYTWSRWSGPTTLEDVLGVTGWAAVPESGATRNTGALANLDDVTTDFIAANAVNGYDADTHDGTGGNSYSGNPTFSPAVRLAQIWVPAQNEGPVILTVRIDYRLDSNATIGDPYELFVRRANGDWIGQRRGNLNEEEGTITLVTVQPESGITTNIRYDLMIRCSEAGNSLFEFVVERHYFYGWEQRR
jgi:hypothetical protein